MPKNQPFFGLRDENISHHLTTHNFPFLVEATAGKMSCKRGKKNMARDKLIVVIIISLLVYSIFERYYLSRAATTQRANENKFEFRRDGEFVPLRRVFISPSSRSLFMWKSDFDSVRG
jgi:membrane protein CcdC involved in cytochrome C biogenesis